MDYKNSNPFKIDNWKTYYINLDNRSDRRKSIDSELAKIGICAERFSALADKDSDKCAGFNLGKRTVYSPRSSDKKLPPHELVPGEWGCAFSHYSILKGYLDSGNKKILAIFEDDAHFCSDFRKRLEYLEDKFNLDWDIFYLGCSCKLLYDKETNIKHVWRISDVAYGTHAMLINPNSIPEILRLMNLYAPNVASVDSLYIYLIPYIKMYCFVPGMVSQSDSLAGNIGKRTNITGHYIKAFGPHVFSENMDDFNFNSLVNSKVVRYYRKYFYINSEKIGRIGFFIRTKFPTLYKILKPYFPDKNY